MEAIIFCGIQASGKSSFYRERFFHSHLRISLDLLRTRNKERQLLETCIRLQQRFVVDNTNPTKEDRARYIGPAKAGRFQVIGYFFQTGVEEALLRNSTRTGKEQVPVAGVRGTYKKLEAPVYEEGFDALYSVAIADGQFLVQTLEP
ncbi:MAG TPA: ATP-binding protein [Chitinophagaceae bacterium]|jgi:predicted kinase|nr:ATP-binding protein [Chitinophagaceae bacterium]